MGIRLDAASIFVGYRPCRELPRGTGGRAPGGRCHVNAATALVEAGADIEARAGLGLTPRQLREWRDSARRLIVVEAREALAAADFEAVKAAAFMTVDDIARLMEVDRPTAAVVPGSRAPPGFLNSSSSGFRAQGRNRQPLSESMPCEGFTERQVFEAFGTLFKFHSLFTVNDFINKVKHCKVAPAVWAMLFLDKVHHVYRRDADGKTLIDTEEADPVAMTVRGLAPKDGGPAHTPTEAARQLFAEVMAEHAKALAGETARWNGNLNGPTVAFELGRRKGKGTKK